MFRGCFRASIINPDNSAFAFLSHASKACVAAPWLRESRLMADELSSGLQEGDSGRACLRAGDALFAV